MVSLYLHHDNNDDAAVKAARDLVVIEWYILAFKADNALLCIV
jgi:hypothetical protein